MKLKGLTKLALSGVALAAVAATLGTSTYAWYVSNSTATVSGITGGTNTTPSGSLLLNVLSKSDQDIITAANAWSNKINYSQFTVKGETLLTPVTKDTATITPTDNPTGWHDKANLAVSTSSAYGYFMFGAQQSDTAKSKITLTFGIANTSTATPTQTAYYSADNITPGTDGATAAGSTFTEDFIFALKFDLRVVELGDSGLTLASALTNNAFGSTLAADSFRKQDDLNTKYAVKDGWCDNGDAHKYYKALTTDNTTSSTSGQTTTTTIDGGETVSESILSNGSIDLQLKDGKKYVIVVRYWLDGADPQCFDSTINQKFALDMQMVATAPGQSESYYNSAA